MLAVQFISTTDLSDTSIVDMGTSVMDTSDASTAMCNKHCYNNIILMKGVKTSQMLRCYQGRVTTFVYLREFHSNLLTDLKIVGNICSIFCQLVNNNVS